MTVTFSFNGFNWFACLHRTYVYVCSGWIYSNFSSYWRGTINQNFWIKKLNYKVDNAKKQKRKVILEKKIKLEKTYID